MRKDDLPFGKRYGYEPVDVPFQIIDINQELRTELWNLFYIYIQRRYENAESYNRSHYETLSKVFWCNFFIKALDGFPRSIIDFGKFVRKYVEQEVWYKVYQFFEYVFKTALLRIF